MPERDRRVVPIGRPASGRRVKVVVATGVAGRSVLADSLQAAGVVDIVGAERTAAAVVALVQSADPDLAVVDLTAPHGLELIATLTARVPSVPILAHGPVVPASLAEAALSAGAQVCLVESASADELQEAVEVLARREHVVAPVKTAAGPVTSRADAGMRDELAQLRADRDRLAAELATTREDHDTLLESLEEGVVTFALDGSVTMANSAAAEILGLSREDLLTRNIYSPGWAALRNDGSVLPVNERAVVLALETGEPQRGMRYGVRRTDGAVRWISVNAVPVKGAEAKPHAVVSSLEDVTERHEAEEALRRSEAQVRAMFEGIALGMAGASDYDGRYIWVNHAFCELMGYEAEELLGMRFLDLNHPDDIGGTLGLYHQLLRGERDRYVLEKRLMRKDGTPVWTRITASLIRDPTGGPPVAVSTVEDITKAKEAEEAREAAAAQLRRANDELRLADELKDNLLGVTSHEMRTPLVGIMGYAETLVDHWRDLDDAERSGIVEAIYRQARGLRSTVEDLVLFANAQAGRLRVEHSIARVNELIERALEARGIDPATIEVRCAPSMAVVADPGLVVHIIGNYLSNAVKYGAPPIAVAVDRIGANVEIRVSDRGSGVDGGFAPFLFERFSQPTSGLIRKAEGTGLGLAVARALAMAQGGDVWYEPNPAGGACFGLRLPTEVPSPGPR